MGTSSKKFDQDALVRFAGINNVVWGQEELPENQKENTFLSWLNC